jgi:uncharacterized SAM-binding protein YcdF (DUF218 family)
MSTPPLQKHQAGRYLIIGIVAIGGIWLASLGAVVLWGTRDGAVRSDAIVVLGAAQYVGRPSPVLKARLDHAVMLWKRGLAPWLVLTGGTGIGDTTSEAAVSRRYVLRLGIPDSVILLENQGRTTTASLAAVANIMSSRRLTHAILVSDPFHMLRLQILARRYGVQCVTSPTRTSPISASPTEALGHLLSESVKVPVTLILSAVGRPM